MKSVYCAVRTKFLNIIHANIGLEKNKNHYILHTVYVFLLVLLTNKKYFSEQS